MFSKITNFLDHSYSRNISFAVLMGALSVLFGSASTALLLAATIVVIFFNPRVTSSEIWSESKVLVRGLPIIIVFPAFYIMIIATSLQGENWLLDAVQTAGSFWQFLLLIPFSIGIYYLSKDANFAGLFSYGCRYGLVFAAPFALFQIFFFNFRPEGFAGNALIFASVCILGSGFSIIKWPEDGKRQRALAWLAFVAGLIAALLTFSRGMLIPIGFVIVATTIYMMLAKSRDRFGAGLFMVMAVITVSILSAAIYSDNGWRIINLRLVEPIQNFQEGKPFDRSLRERIDMQVTGFHAFRQEPITGYGLNNAVREANKVSRDALGRQTNYEFSHLHNAYLTYLVGGGIFLFTLFLLVIISPLLIMRSISKFQKETDLFFFSVILVGVYSTIAITNVVFRNDQLLTVFSVAVTFILVRHIQLAKKQEEHRIPDLGIIAEGINPIGKKSPKFAE